MLSPCADGAEDLVGDGCGEAGVVVGGDAVAEEDDLVADMDAGDGGDIDHGQIHRDAAYDRCTLAAQDDQAAGSRI